MSSPPEVNAASGRTDGLLLALGAGLLYALAAPDLLWGTDSLALLHGVQTGETSHSTHLLYLPLVAAFARWGEMVGFDAFLCLRAASTLATAFGLWACHRASLALGADRRRAAALTVIIAATPAVAFFAMIVEIQGVFFAFIGLTWLAAARAVRRPGVWSVALLGLCTGLSSMAHSSGHLLPLLVGTFALMHSEALRKRCLLLGLVGGAAHAAIPVALSTLTGLPVLPALRASFQFVDIAARLSSPLGASTSIVLYEWFMPFMPLSLAVFAALRDHRLRKHFFALHGFLLVYGMLAWPLLAASWDERVMEHGGYFVPLVFPLAWLVLRPGRTRRVAWLAPAGLVVTLGLTWGEAIRQSDPFATEDALSVVGDGGAILLTHSSENVLELMLANPRVEIYRMDQITGVTARSQAINTAFDIMVAEAGESGLPVLMTGRLQEALEQNDLPVWQHIHRHYALRTRDRGDFEGDLIVRRTGKRPR